MSEWQQVMTLSEFGRWKEYYAREPFGADIDNWRTAYSTSALMNATLRLSGDKAFKSDDFLPKIIGHK